MSTQLENSESKFTWGKLMRFFFNLSFFLFVILMSCTTNDMASGGDDVANGYIQANSIDTLFNNVIGAEAELVGVFITEAGDSSFYNSITLTDASGICRFSNVPNGHYVLTIKDTISKRGAIKTRLTVENDSLISSEALIVRKQATVKGRIANWSTDKDVSIHIPGVSGVFSPDVNGFFTIPDLYIGDYDICLISQSIVNYLTVSVKPGSSDTIYLRDINFAEDLTEASSIYSFYDNDIERSYQIVPLYYDPQDEPSWYDDHDFTQVDYLEVVEGSDTLKTIWHFPMIVAVSDSTLLHYGSDSTALITLINNQINVASDIFNLAKIDGKVKFSVDSIYFFSDVPNTELVNPPLDYALKLIYDAAKQSTIGNALWGPETKAGIYSYSPDDPGGMFGDEGMKSLLWILARSRECFYIELCSVDSSKDAITGEGFYIPDYILNYESISNWSPTSEVIMNFTATDLQPTAHLAYKRFPDTISLQIEDSNLIPLSNVNVEIFAASYLEYTIKDSIAYSGITNGNGLFTLPENPFLNDSKNNPKHTNLLIRTISSGDTLYKWLPLYEVIDSCFTDNIPHYKKRIVLE